MKNIKYISIIISVILLMSCEKEELISDKAYDVFYLRNRDADMPVYVKGNTASKTFILWLHGGPGDSSIAEKFGDQEINKKLETDYANVYWDQRCTGNSTGTFDPKDITVDLMVEDLEKLVAIIKSRFGNDISLYLLGHSWGGTLSYAYLQKPENHAQISGFINIAGPHNLALRVEQQKDLYIEIAKRQVAFGINADTWQQGIEKFEKLDLGNKDNWEKLAPEIPDALIYLEEHDSIITNDLKYFSTNAIFGTPNIEMVLMNYMVTRKSPLLEEIEDIDYSTELSNITLPVLFCSGHYDLTVPPSQFDVAINLVGSSNKTHKEFYHSAHYPHTSEPELFYSTIKAFITEAE